MAFLARGYLGGSDGLPSPPLIRPFHDYFIRRSEERWKKGIVLMAAREARRALRAFFDHVFESFFSNEPFAVMREMSFRLDALMLKGGMYK